MIDNTVSSITGPVGQLDISIQIPQQANARSIAILCHPLPTAGGTMNNKVIYTLGQSCHARGIATLKFNTRGTGTSEGQFDHGRGETDDLMAVIDYVCQHLGTEDIWLGGFSFGSFVAYNASKQWHSSARLRQLILIAPPVTRYDYQSSKVFDYPLLLIQGGKDELVDAQDVNDWHVNNKANYPSSEYLMLPEASHFFHGMLIRLRHEISNHLSVDSIP